MCHQSAGGSHKIKIAPSETLHISNTSE